MEKQHAKKFLKKYLTVTGGPAAVDALDDENKAAKAKEFVKKYFTVVGGPEAIDAAAKQESKYLTMTLPEGSDATQISINRTNPDLNRNIQYRVNNGEWTNWDFTSSQPISAVANDVVQWRGVNPEGLSIDDGSYIYFVIPNEVHLSGNVMSLIDGVGDTKVIPCSYCFESLFENTKIKTVTEDFLPATTLTEGCYVAMFGGCSSLEKAPVLPARILAVGCYAAMFIQCTSLENAPELPATTLARNCYQDMFEECSSLVKAPELPATTLADSCYVAMFGGCSSLVKAPELPATTLTNGCYGMMFAMCSNLQNVTCLATNISAQDCTTGWLLNVASTGTFNKAAGVEWSSGVDGIPEGWTVIEPGQPSGPTGPIGPTGPTGPTGETGPVGKYLTITLPEGSPETQISINKNGEPVGTNIQYRVNNGDWTDWNFTDSQDISANANDVIQWKGDNPTGLSKDFNNYIYFNIPSEVNLSGNVMSLIDGVGKTKDIPCSYCFTGLFKDTKIKTVSEDFLPATKLTYNCYYDMFSGCTSLTTAPALPATTLADSCYYKMFYLCSSLVSAPKILPATTLTEGCYWLMFKGCSSLVKAPELPATVLSNGCYNYMFAECSKLQHVTCLAEYLYVSASECTTSWLRNVSATGTFVKAAGVDIWDRGASGIPKGWTIKDYGTDNPDTGTDNPEPKYLTMTLPENSLGTQISINKQGAPVGTNIQYRVNNGDWTDWDFTSSQPISAKANDVIQWKGVNLDGLSDDDRNYIYFDIPNEVHLSGNVMSLIDGVGDRKDIPCYHCFCYLFRDTKIKNVAEDLLPATTLKGDCYYSMFYGCTSLENAPALPATKLYSSCYNSMFKGCTSLVTAPELPATTLADYCYSTMFSSCSSIVNAPALPATTLANSCYYNMFYGCSSLVNAPVLPAITLADSCYQDMFYRCTSLENAPALPATTLDGGCYGHMFSGCTALVNAPALPATKLYSSCYNSMFKGCTSLATAPALPATTLTEWCYASMFQGCTSLVDAPALPATRLKESCYRNMFDGCTSLENAPELPATTLYAACYENMFSGCTALVNAPEMSATTLAGSCCYEMFSGCTSLATAPVLPATRLIPYCYYGMFNGCSNLQNVTCLATSISASNCTTNWLSGVASTGTFVKASGTGWTRDGNGIPEGWAVNDYVQPTGETTVQQ